LIRNFYARTPPIVPRHEAHGNPVTITQFHLQRAIAASDPQDARWSTCVANAHDDFVALWSGRILWAERFNKQLPAPSAAT
jgi:hypothetical protein